MPAPQQAPKSKPAPAKPPELRDPFLPVDYIPPVVVLPEDIGPQSTNPVPVVQGGPIAPKLAWPKLNLKATMKSPEGKYVGIIEGIGVVEAGDIVQKKKDNIIYRWKIDAVSEKGVSFTKLDARPAR